MLDKLRDQAFQALAATAHCTLSTAGPAGLCASHVALAVTNDRLTVLIPNTSDHLFNLELTATVVLTGETWQLTGTATLIETTDTPFTQQQTTWCCVYAITPRRMHMDPDDNEHTPRTIDF